MGKDKQKSRRGKIILGTYGVRRRRKKDIKTEVKPELAIKEKKLVKEVKEAPAEKVKTEAAEKVKKEPRPKKEATLPKETKAKK
jgi:ribosomal small subunit protein bTHX